MAGRPGTIVRRQAQRAVPGIPTDTGQTFMVGFTESGPANTATQVDDLAGFKAVFGNGDGLASTLHSAVELAFGEGAGRIYVSRVVGPAAVVDGDGDEANATDTQWAAALTAFSAELGPGQVLAPGRTTTVAHGQLLDHASANNRTALLDAPNGASKATLLALAAATGALTDSKFGGLFATWVTIGQRVAGVDREVPGSAFVAGLIARSDSVNDAGTWPIGTKGSNRSAPGNGIAAYALSATSEFTDADREDLTEAGVNITLDDPNGLRLYGFRSPTLDPEWTNLGHQRIFMEIQSQAQRIAEGFVGERIVPATITRFHQALDGYLYGLFQSGALFAGLVEPSYDQSYAVNTASPVNTASTAEARELNAELYVRVSEVAELVVVVVTKVPVSSPVAA